jgi:hypothetical protein
MSNPPLAYTATPYVQAIALKITRDLPPPGQPLTGNRTLAARYNVGPDSVRDAKAVLAGLGILTRKGFIHFVTEAKDAPTQPDDEHEHVPRRDSWVITRSFLPADLMEPEHYPVTAACQECQLPIYGHHFASPWLLGDAYAALYGEFGTDPAPGEPHGA